MTAEKTVVALGWRVYGLGVLAVGMASLVFREFDPGQPVPDGLPARVVLACAAGVLMVVAAAAIEWRRTVAWGAAVLLVYFTLIVVILMNGRVLLRDYAIYVTYENIAMQVAIALAALIIFSSTAAMGAARAARLTRLSQLLFGVCALVFGGAHFVYMNMTAPMVPKWLPPSQVFWGYLTGVCFVAAGLALLSGVQARLAAILLTVMLALFGLLANLPILLADHASHFNWTESAVNLAVVGAAWVVAESLARARTPTTGN